MVFSDPAFLFVFLPAAFLIFHGVRIWLGGNAAIATLVVLSCLFYAYWSVPFLGLLLLQIGFNYLAAKRLETKPFKGLLTIAILVNLCLLGYFKYRNFFLEIAGDVSGYKFILTRLVVPLAISFHTFQQIALLVDVKDGEAETPPLLNYVLFVVFFPQLIAGPIVLHREMGRQVEAVRNGKGPGFAHLGAGAFLFVFGLFKKVYLADQLAPYVDVAFSPHMNLLLPEAWLAAVSYALQLFFDFSGYSDMAVGLGLMFGFQLPYNFLIPFSSTSMIEYWKRWHITMTRFFTMYVYMPIALSLTRFARAHALRAAPAFVLSTIVPTLAAFMASGLWHGAGWTFIMFGLANGLGLTINHIWKSAKAPQLPAFAGWFCTAVMILITLVYFRSTDLAQAHAILGAMFVPHPFGLPRWMASHIAGYHGPVTDYAWLGESGITFSVLGLVAVLAPLSVLTPAYSAQGAKLKPGYMKAAGMVVMFCLAMSVLDQPRTFIYFAF